MPPSPAPFGIYVHAPWCRVVCPYCAFNVRPDRRADWQAWAAGVLRDWAAVAPLLPGKARTVYLGGGTPSLAPIGILARILAALPRSDDAEVTLEVDPGTVDRDRLAALLDLGVTRLSVGVQTFHRAHLRRLGRGHDLAATERLLRDVAALGPESWSLDLMFALPGQSLADLDEDLDRVVALAPPHVSLYGLTYEPGTPFARLRDGGRLAEVDEDVWAAMYARIGQRLRAAGWERYEVSNLARPGHRSRHNEAGWRGGFYAGLGPGAHGFLPPTPAAPWGLRTVTHPALQAWRDAPAPQAPLPAGPAAASDTGPFAEVEALDARTSAVDLLLSTLRHVDGTPREALAARGLALDPAVVTGLVRGGLIRQDPDRLCLTEEGVPLADGVTARLAAALRPLVPGSAPSQRA